MGKIKDDILKSRLTRTYRTQPTDPPGGQTFAEKQTQAMGGGYYNPPTPITPVRESDNTFTEQQIKQMEAADAKKAQAAPTPAPAGNVSAGMQVNPGQWAINNAKANYTGQQVVTNADGTTPTATPQISDEDVVAQLMGGFKPMTPDEVKAEEKRRRTNDLITSIGDGLNSIAKMYYINRGAPFVAANESMSKAMQDRYDKIDAEYRLNQKNYLDTLLKIQQQRLAAERQKALDDYNQQRLEAAEAYRKAIQDRFDTNIDFQRDKFDRNYDLQRDKYEATKAHQERQDAVAQSRATTAATRAANGGRSGGGRSSNSGYDGMENYEYREEYIDPNTKVKKVKITKGKQKKGSGGGGNSSRNGSNTRNGGGGNAFGNYSNK